MDVPRTQRPTHASVERMIAVLAPLFDGLVRGIVAARGSVPVATVLVLGSLGLATGLTFTDSFHGWTGWIGGGGCVVILWFYCWGSTPTDHNPANDPIPRAVWDSLPAPDPAELWRTTEENTAVRAAKSAASLAESAERSAKRKAAVARLWPELEAENQAMLARRRASRKRGDLVYRVLAVVLGVPFLGVIAFGLFVVIKTTL